MRVNKKKTLLISLLFIFTNCAIGPSSYQQGTLYQLSSRALSLSQPELRTCIFDPHYLIVHFPMFHVPPTGQWTEPTYEKVAQSQFQLLHTIIDYSRSHRRISIFDEHVSTDAYDENYFQSLSRGLASRDTYTRLDNRVFNLEERLKSAQHLFGNGIPGYYEHLSMPQKDFLFQTGASFSLYFLKEIPRLYKTIALQKLKLVEANLRDQNNQLQLEGRDYWVFTFRELELKREVLSFLQKNHQSQRIIFIAYGANHDFSDEFIGYPFQSGHSFCLNWLKGRLPPTLP